jgi:hypothetical protein
MSEKGQFLGNTLQELPQLPKRNLINTYTDYIVSGK